MRTNKKQTSNQASNQPINQLTNQATNHAINQSNKAKEYRGETSKGKNKPKK